MRYSALRSAGVVVLLGLLSGVRGAAQGAEPSGQTVRAPAPYAAGWADTDLPGKRLSEFLVLGGFPEPEKHAPVTDTLRPLVLDMDYLAALGGELSVRPKAGDAVKTAAGVDLQWKATTRPAEPAADAPRPPAVERTTDLASGLTSKSGRILYAYCEFDWDRDAEGALAYDITDDARIWVNGKLVHERAAVLRWPRDEMHLARVPLQKGTNRLLVKLRSGYGMRILARVMPVEDARAFPVIALRPRRLTPVGGDAQTFRVLTDDAFGAMHRDWPVTASVLAPGGKVLAQADLKLGDIAKFDSSNWPQGPCEIRVTAKLPLTGELSAYLPWYHGDLPAAVGKLKTLKAEEPSAATDLIAYHIATASAARLAKATDADPEALLNTAHHLLMEQAEYENRKAGGPGGEHADGFVRIAWRATNDLAPQFTGAHLPMNYTRDHKWPLVVYLHGNDRSNRPYSLFYDEQRRRLLFAAREAIVIEPHGRGNVGYVNMSEEDVLHCIAATKQALPVDEDRVYLTGYSMGGMGTESIGARYPHLFAALGPAGAFQSLIDTTSPEWSRLSPLAKYRQLRRDLPLESLWSTFVFPVIGEKDAERNVKGARDLTTRLQSWGYPVRLWTVPNMGHEMGFVFDGPGFGLQMDEMLRYRRDNAPTRVRVRGMSLTEGRTHWAQVMQLEASFESYELDASINGPGVIRVLTRGVLELRLTPPASLIGPSMSVEVLWNGSASTHTMMADGSVSIRAAGYNPGDKAIKTPKRCGPSERAFAHAFVVVTGTGNADPAIQTGTDALAKALAEKWSKTFHTSPRMRTDVELTEAEAAATTLVLLGVPKPNTPAAKLLEAAGVSVGADEVRLAGQAFKAGDPAVIALRPHPSNKEQYLLVVQAASTVAMQRVLDQSVGGSGAAPLSGGEFDYVVLGDGKSADVGLFDWAWNVSDATRGTIGIEELAPRGRFGEVPASRGATP